MAVAGRFTGGASAALALFVVYIASTCDVCAAVHNYTVCVLTDCGGDAACASSSACVDGYCCWHLDTLPHEFKGHYTIVRRRATIELRVSGCGGNVAPASTVPCPSSACPSGSRCGAAGLCCPHYGRTCADGTDALPLPTVCDGDQHCPPLHYCNGGRMCCRFPMVVRPCPDGSAGLSTPIICGHSVNTCPSGHFCSDRSVCCRNANVPRVCGNGAAALPYPPMCSAAVACPNGFHCAPGRFCCPGATATVVVGVDYDLQPLPFSCPDGQLALSSPRQCSDRNSISELCPSRYYCEKRIKACCPSNEFARKCPGGGAAARYPPQCLPHSIDQCPIGHECSSTGVCCPSADVIGWCSAGVAASLSCDGALCPSGFECQTSTNLCCPTQVCSDGSRPAGRCTTLSRSCATAGHVCTEDNVCCPAVPNTGRCHASGRRPVGACINGQCGKGFTCELATNMCCPV